MDKYLRQAYNEAKKAYNKMEVPVGAVIVKDNKIIAKAHNLRETKNNALAHAEIICINKACKKLGTWRLEECSMYVTLEPCQMCLGAIKESRISNVFYGAKDSKEELNIMDNKSVICKDLHSEECSKILKDFFHDLRNKQK